ncbi:MAG TPA: EAL domain-containing protein [Thermoanaerobaculia bacterium]
MTDYSDFYRELRTDWLRLRGCLYDPNTNLPSLPTVLDGVRRRLEAGDRVGLVYLEPVGGNHLEAIHGWEAYDALIREIAEALRHGLGRRGEGTPLALAGVRSDEFVAFPMLGSADVGAAAELESWRLALVDEVEARLLERPEASFRAPLQSAAVELELEPTVRIERSISHGLHRARELCRQESERRRSGRLAELERILAQRDVVVRYQPIVELASGRIHGFEALGTAPPSAAFETADMLFSFAEETGRILELDRLCRLEALRRTPQLLARAAPCKLFLNCSAEVVHDDRLLADLVGGAGALGVAADTLVLEITERVAITEWQAFRACLGSLRDAGVRVAIDDMGSGYSSLRAVAEIEPDYLKFDLSLVSDIHHSAIKRELLGTLVTLARKIAARPIAEGVEKLEEFTVVRGMGIDYGQGFFFARPAEAAEAGRVHFPAPIAG